MNTRSASTIFLFSTLLLVVSCAGPVRPADRVVTTPTPPQVSPTSSPTLVSELTNRPNIILILTDDLDAASIKYMRSLKALLIDQGTLFSNYFVNVSLCCPSRTSTLRGQYATNTKIIGNQPPQGGFQMVYEDGMEKSTLATWLQQEGYKTMLAGKYLNGYPDKSNPMYIPPGWTEWYSAMKGNAYSEFNYTLNENGKQVAYRATPEDYGTDVYAQKVIDFVQRSSAVGQPFFVYLATYAPHGPSTPAPRHANLFPDAVAPRSPNYDEADVSDKPSYIRNLPLLSWKDKTTIDSDYRKRLQSLQAVDEAIASIVNSLRDTGQLDNTYVFFTSDNGFHLGNHRQKEGKVAPYDEEIRVPLIVRGPGVPERRTLGHIVGNVDLAPTFAELGGAKIPNFVDGRSLVPLLSANAVPQEEWRQAYLLQGGEVIKSASLTGIGPEMLPSVSVTDPMLLELPDMDEAADPAAKEPGGIPPFVGIHTAQYTYIEYSSGERELYDLKVDPYQLKNIASTSNDLVKELSARLNALARCSGAGCRTAERGP